jgi:hypothetical protein
LAWASDCHPCAASIFTAVAAAQDGSTIRYRIAV